MAFLWATAATPTFAGNLWQNTTSGMNPDDVKKLYPDATTPREIDGQKTMLLKNIMIFDEKFDAIFYFRSERLTKVTLNITNALNPSAFQARIPQATFALIRDELMKKYGQPVNTRSSLMGNNIDFIKNDTSIELTYYDTSNLSSNNVTRSISITYEAPDGGNTPL